MSQPVMLYSYLKLSEIGARLNEGNDPGKEDISYIIEVARMIPKNQQELENIESEQLATCCLSAFNRTSELFAKASLWMNYQKINLDSIYGSLIAESKQPATIRKEIVKSESRYMVAAEEYEKAKAYVQFYSGVLSSFEKGHYWAKSKEQKEINESKMSGYEPCEKNSSKGEPYSVNKKNMEENNVTTSTNPVEDVSL